MHSSSPQMVKESKNLCQPSGTSSKWGASGLLFSHSSSSTAIEARNCRLVNSIARMVTIGAALGVPRRPDLNGRDELTDGVYDFLGNAPGLFSAGSGLFEAGVQLL